MIRKLSLAIIFFSTIISVHAQDEAWTLDKRPHCLLTDEGGREGGRHLRTSLRKEDAPMMSTGSPVIPVILVDFSNVKCTLKETEEELKEAFHLFFNGTDDGTTYTSHGSTASVREYFTDQSNGIFKPQFDIVGHVTLTKERMVYAKNRPMLRDEALAAMSDIIAENVSRYDSNDDGIVDMAYVVFAGGGSNVKGNPEDCVWPCEFSSVATAGGIKYACSALCAELYRDGDPTMMVGVGVFLHEFCHALGLPDMYDINYLAPGMDIWSLMDYGENIYNGRRPTNLNAYERSYLDWSETVTLTEPATVRLAPLTAGGKVYRVQNSEAEGEYYLLEYRNANDFDSYIFGTWLAMPDGGLLVYHIDEDAQSWSMNRVNTDIDHQRITIIPANNVFTLLDNFQTNKEWKEERRGQIYPGTYDVTYLTDESTPASVVYHGGFMHQPIYDISIDTVSKTLTLKYMPLGTLDVPDGLDATFSAEEVTLAWNATENAECYNVECDIDGQVIRKDSVEGNMVTIFSSGSVNSVEYRVKALADEYRDSEWSEWTRIEPSTSVTEVQNETYGRVSLFSLNGVRLGTFSRASLSANTLKPGVYVVRHPDGRREKICVMQR